MNGFNVLRGREYVRQGAKGNTTVYYCAGYIKYLPQRGAIYGIEFSGTDANDASEPYKSPASSFKYYVFCSENAFLDYIDSIVDSRDDATTNSKAPELKNRFSKDSFSIGNPASFVVSSGSYDIANTKEWPANIGFQGADYQHDPRPYSNIDGAVDSNNVQYPLYLVVVFDGSPTITTLDYQLIYET